MDDLYFAYGSNMDAAQMERRVPGAKRVGEAFLEGFSLTFNRKGTYRNGGVASVEPMPSHRTYGVLWSVDKDMLARLDQIEDVAAYRREKMSVTSVSGQCHECFIYRAYPEGEIAPDPNYLEVIISAAEKQNFPATYLDFLRDFRV